MGVKSHNNRVSAYINSIARLDHEVNRYFMELITNLQLWLILVESLKKRPAACLHAGLAVNQVICA